MKLSKVFLGVTTALLAVAGVAATKHYIPIRTRFYITVGLAWCNPIQSSCARGFGTVTCFGTYTNGLGVQKSGPLFTKGNPISGSPTSVAACNGASKLRYDGTSR